MDGTGTPFVGRFNAMSSPLSPTSVLFVSSSSSLSSTVLFLLSAALLIGHVTGAPKGYDYDIYDDGYDPFNGPNIIKTKKVVDYYSKPQYAFGFEVDDYENLLHHGRWEIRDGDVTQGQYRVLLPDGRVQIVSYIADKQGYRATVEYIGKGAHPPPPPAYAHVKIPKHQYVEPAAVVPFVKPVPVAAFPIVASPAPPIVHSAVPLITEPFATLVPRIKAPPGLTLATAIPPVIQDYHPVKIKVNSLPVNGPLPVVDPYAVGHGYGLDPAFAASSHNKISRKRALLYDRTLFRKDVERRPASRKNKN